MDNKVKVYSIHVCPWCDKVKKYLKSKGIDYEERNVEDNEEYFNELKAITGDEIVPVTTIDGKEFAVSFDKPKLDKILGLA